MSIRLGVRSLPLALLTVACASTPPVGGASSIQVVGSSTLPVPVESDLSEQGRPYYMGPRDKLTIDVLGLPELSNREITIDANGDMSFPIVGRIHAGGQTPAQLQATIAAALRSGGVRNPQVAVNVKEELSRTLTVDGQVKDPGIYPVIGRMTLLSAVAAAKGPDEYAKLSDVVIFRTVAGQKMAGLYSLKSIRRGNYPDPEVYPSDIIVVGDSAARRIFKDTLTILPNVLTPLIVLLRR